MDKLNESPMLMTNYLMTTLRSDNHALDREQVEKCYNGLLEEYGKVGCSHLLRSRILAMRVFFVIWLLLQASCTNQTRKWRSI